MISVQTQSFLDRIDRLFLGIHRVTPLLQPEAVMEVEAQQELSQQEPATTTNIDMNAFLADLDFSNHAMEP